MPHAKPVFIFPQAYSAYFYTFDFLGLAPQAPLPKVTSTIETFCKKSWNSVRNHTVSHLFQIPLKTVSHNDHPHT